MTDQNDQPERSGINPTVAFVTIAVLVGLAILGASIIITIRPEAAATFSNTIIVIIGIAVSFAGTVGIVAPLAKKTTRIERVVQKTEKQTNGTLSAKEAEINRLRAKLIESGVIPDDHS